MFKISQGPSLLKDNYQLPEDLCLGSIHAMKTAAQGSRSENVVQYVYVIVRY